MLKNLKLKLNGITHKIEICIGTVNFLILRIPKADSGPGIKPYKLVLDYTKGSKNLVILILQFRKILYLLKLVEHIHLKSHMI